MKRILLIFLCLVPAFRPLRAQVNEMALPDYYLQYVPIAAGLSLGWCGVESRNNTLDRFIVTGVGAVSTFAIGQLLKATTHEMRPDGTTDNSFPSGHTATAFLGAEIVRHEYGLGWGLAAYGVATSVAALRVYHHRHFWWDTLAGAGLGILCANIGYWTLEPVHKLFGIGGSRDLAFSLSPAYDPLSGAVCTSLQVRF